MSAIFDRLTRLFEDGHTRDLDDLLTDSRFADADRTADAAVLIAAEALAALSVRPVGAESESQSQSQSEPMKKSAIGGHPNQCLGIESSNGYYTSMPASVIKIVSWQAALLLNSMSK